MVSLFSIPFGSVYHARTFIPMQNLSVSTWFGMVLTQIVTWVYKDFSHLEAPTKYQYLSGITNLIPTGRFFDAIIDVGSPTIIYQTGIGPHLLI